MMLGVSRKVSHLLMAGFYFLCPMSHKHSLVPKMVKTMEKCEVRIV
jgi:hypothetical protein